MSDDNVIKFTGITYLDIPADDVLNGAIGKLSGAIVIGYDMNGDDYFASSYADNADMLWLLERMKQRLLETGNE